jgi:hypothetical protein
MFTTRSFNKHTPTVDGVVFELLGTNAEGLQLFLTNQDSAKSIIYYFEESTDGVTYDRIEFTNGGNSNQFSLTAGGTHSIKVTSTAPRVRMRASGDADLGIILSTAVATDTGTTPITIS